MQRLVLCLCLCRHAKLFFGEANVETANGSGEAYL